MINRMKGMSQSLCIIKIYNLLFIEIIRYIYTAELKKTFVKKKINAVKKACPMLNLNVVFKQF